MVTPRSENCKARVTKEAEQTESTANTRLGLNKAPRGVKRLPTTRPVMKVTLCIKMMTRMTLRQNGVEIAQHRPLGKITPFRGRLDESENSMQWLREFVYEMKGTHTSQRLVHGLLTETHGWCRTLAQSSISKDEAHFLLSDKLISYYCSQFSQSANTRYYRAKRSEKEHIRDYLNRLNGYARSANIKFERSGREAREHVKHFLETCGDRDLERQLTPMQLQGGEASVESLIEPSRDDKRHTSSSGSYGRHDSRSRSQERSRSEPRHTSRVALAETSVADLITELQT
ncbi:LOW QUALITY PROTEIN: hypothetical protein PHMEG_00039609, partial [Phytophthora megakarya]